MYFFRRFGKGLGRAIYGLKGCQTGGGVKRGGSRSGLVLPSIAARGRNRRGETRLMGSIEVLGPLRGLGIRPLVSVYFGVSETPSQRPLRAPERLSGPRGRLFRGLGEVCPFSKEQGKKVGHSEASERPRFPGCLLRGFQPSGSYPQATDNSFFVLFVLFFLGLSRFFRDFPDLLGDGPRIFLICPFPLSRPIKSTYKEQSRKCPRHNMDLSRKSGRPPWFGNPPV